MSKKKPDGHEGAFTSVHTASGFTDINLPEDTQSESNYIWYEEAEFFREELEHWDQQREAGRKKLGHKAPFTISVDLICKRIAASESKINPMDFLNVLFDPEQIADLYENINDPIHIQPETVQLETVVGRLIEGCTSLEELKEFDKRGLITDKTKLICRIRGDIDFERSYKTIKNLIYDFNTKYKSD
jgi:hypothetical protein